MWNPIYNTALCAETGLCSSTTLKKKTRLFRYNNYFSISVSDLVYHSFEPILILNNTLFTSIASFQVDGNVSTVYVNDSYHDSSSQAAAKRTLLQFLGFLFGGGCIHHPFFPPPAYPGYGHHPGSRLSVFGNLRNGFTFSCNFKIRSGHNSYNWEWYFFTTHVNHYHNTGTSFSFHNNQLRFRVQFRNQFFRASARFQPNRHKTYHVSASFR